MFSKSLIINLFVTSNLSNCVFVINNTVLLSLDVYKRQSRSNATSSSAGSNNTIKIQPGVSSWRSITISNIYTVCKNYNSALNSHMMKNDEWGAVAYLSKSKYGKQNEEVWINKMCIRDRYGTSNALHIAFRAL